MAILLAVGLTVSDIASAAGVSQATAARALGNYGSVSDGAREKVLEAANRLGYRRNELAAALVAGSTQTIGLVVGDIENPFFATVARGVADAVEVEGHTLLLANSDEDLERERHAVDALRSRQVDGLIVASSSAEDVSFLESASASGTPVVLIDRPMPEAKLDTVTVENEAGAEAAVAHLIEVGHRRIGVVTDRPEIASTGERLDGYRTALDRAGLEFDEGLVAEGGPSQEDGRRGALKLLERADRPTALFTASNLATYGALSAITSLGLTIPDDVALIGFDDFPLAEVLAPPISVVSQPVSQIGQEAGRLLLERLAGEQGPPRRVRLKTALTVRGSSGGPRS